MIRTLAGRKVLYKHISKSNIEYFKNRPLILKSALKEHRDGIIIGSACEQGELYQAILHGKSDEELEEIADFYDYLKFSRTATMLLCCVPIKKFMNRSGKKRI